LRITVCNIKAQEWSDHVVYFLVATLVPAGFIENNSNWHLQGMFKAFIPIMKEFGVTDEHIKAMMVDNPRRLFAGK